MAASIIPFPKNHDQNLPEVEQLIRQWLTEMAASSDAVENIAERMMVFINKYATKEFEPTFDLPVPPNVSAEQAQALLASIEKGIDTTAQEVQEMINRIIIERLFLELEIYENRKFPRIGSDKH